ncbi:helix-turn-helix domain-containing protein [Nonomuraea thailandensis]
MILHPIRLRIMWALSGGRIRTTSELCESLPDVPKTTLYRHVGLLADAGLLEVAGEQRVRGWSSATTGCGRAPPTSTSTRPGR